MTVHVRIDALPSQANQIPEMLILAGVWSPLFPREWWGKALSEDLLCRYIRILRTCFVPITTGFEAFADLAEERNIHLETIEASEPEEPLDASMIVRNVRNPEDREAEFDAKWDELAVYNREKMKGVEHPPEVQVRMLRLQAKYSRLQANGLDVVSEEYVGPVPANRDLILADCDAMEAKAEEIERNLG